MGHRTRITVPVDADQAPGTTIRLSAALARQCSSDVEFVAGRPGSDLASTERRLRFLRDAALSAGAPHACWTLLDGGSGEEVGAYATWSGSALLCLGGRRHGHGTTAWIGALVRGGAVPIVVMGPNARLSGGEYQRLVVGVDGAHPHDQVVRSAVGLAAQLGLTVTFTQVVPPTTPPIGDYHETGFLHQVTDGAHGADASFDVLHATRPAAGIISFVGRDERAMTMIGATRHINRVRACSHVVREIVRRSLGPVLLVPVPS